MVTVVRDATLQRVLDAFRTSTNRLEHLTENDWTLIMDKAVRRRFAAGDPIFEYGKRNSNIFIIGRGMASILNPQGSQIASVGSGEIIGEMSFLEGSQPSASVRAHIDVEAFALPWSTLHSLFELYPHLASRFYRSIAVSLSRRLRKQIAD